MTQSSSFEIPYRLETLDDILRAQKENLLDLGAGPDYDLMRSAARRLTIVKPPALLNAHRVIKDFYLVRTDKHLQVKVDHIVRAGFDPVRSFHLIELALPWAGDLARCRDFIELLQTFPPEIQALCGVTERPGTLTAELDSVLNSQKLVKDEALAITRTGRTKHLTREDLKRLIAGRTLFEPSNEDVLEAFRASQGSRPDAASLYQNACAELLFKRIPSFLGGILPSDAVTLRRKFLNRIARLGVTPREKMALFGYFPHDVPHARLFPTMEKVASIARKVLSADRADQIDDYIIGLRHQVGALKSLYDDLFLSPELKQMRKLHVPGRLGRTEHVYHEEIIKVRTRLSTLDFHPAKDFMDLSKSRFSDDCTTADLSEKQLAAPEFFNIRIFRTEEWIGNIYMLDYTASRGVLLVDRVQVPRKFDAAYLNFFGHLREIFQEMFSSVEYQKALLPLRISNHGSIQKAWNQYRKKLTTERIDLPTTSRPYFESLQQKAGYSVLA
jgi:hypothetical protein